MDFAENGLRYLKIKDIIVNRVTIFSKIKDIRLKSNGGKNIILINKFNLLLAYQLNSTVL